MAKTIAIVNQKGGVGKTTTTFNLGASLVRQGKKVLLVDLDQQGNLTFCMGHDSPEELQNNIAQVMLDVISDEDYNIKDYIFTAHGMDYIGCNIYMSAVEINLVNAISREMILKSILNEVQQAYDYILLDCAPSLGMITINALSAADSVIIPLQAEKLAELGLELLIKDILRVKKKINPDLEIEGILFVSVPTNQKDPKETIQTVRDRFGEVVNVYDYIIPRLTEVAKATRKQQAMLEANQNSVVSNLYGRLAQEVMNNGR